jgi:copper chaperone CopZ
MRELRLHVDGMSCRHCVRDVTSRLRDVAGVEMVAADATTCEVVLHGTMSDSEVLAALVGSSYEVRLMDRG